jgi:hypothetical protein
MPRTDTAPRSVCFLIRRAGPLTSKMPWGQVRRHVCHWGYRGQQRACMCWTLERMPNLRDIMMMQPAGTAVCCMSYAQAAVLGLLCKAQGGCCLLLCACCFVQHMCVLSE